MHRVVKFNFVLILHHSGIVELPSFYPFWGCCCWTVSPLYGLSVVKGLGQLFPQMKVQWHHVPFDTVATWDGCLNLWPFWGLCVVHVHVFLPEGSDSLWGWTQVLLNQWPLHLPFPHRQVDSACPCWPTMPFWYFFIIYSLSPALTRSFFAALWKPKPMLQFEAEGNGIFVIGQYEAQEGFHSP